MNGLYRACLLLVLGVSAAVLFIQRAQAQCAARDVMRRNPGVIASSSGAAPPALQAACGIGVRNLNPGANDGAGPLLLGENVSGDAQFDPPSRFVFASRADFARVHQ